MRAAQGRVGPDRAEQSHKITRADATALWHAVQAFADLIRAMKTMPDITDACKAAETARFDAAKKALRKVQAHARADRKARAKA